MLASKKLFILLLIFMPLAAIAQNTLTIKAEGVRSSEGYIAVGVYADAADFLKKDKAFAGMFEVSNEGTTTIKIPNLPNGTYAVSIFHDENGNMELDTNFIGIPKESCAFSKAKMKTFGPPDFEDCTFEVLADTEIKISI